MADIYMDVPAVMNISKTFGTVGEVLEGVSKALDALSNVLKATAFVGLVGGYAVAQYIDSINPQIKDVSERCEELSKDVESAAKLYEQGDFEGANQFFN